MRNLLKYMAIIVFALASSLALAQQKTIKMGSMTWEDSRSVALVTKKFLEKQGYPVELTVFSEWGIAYAALQKGDINLFITATDFIAADHWNRYKNRLEKISTAYFGVYQCLVVPSYMEIDSIEQLNSVADQVRGRIIGVESGSGVMREAEQAIKAYGLDYQLISGSTAAAVAELRGAMERKQPIVTMLWTPSWMMQTFDVKFLKDPKGIFAPPQAYYWVARRGFLQDDDRRLRQSIATVHLGIDEVVAITGEINAGKTLEEAVDGWWDSHQMRIERWTVMAD